MEMRPGYKQTEVGVVPDDWNATLLTDISQKITDGDHATPKREKDGYFLLSARNVLNGRIDVSDVDFVGEIEYRRMRQRCNPEVEDILVSCSGTIGRVSVVPPNFECVLVRSVALIKNDKRISSGAFIHYWLQGAHAQKQIYNSINQGAQPNLFLNHIERLALPLPALREQCAIATVLSDVDALLSSLDALIAKKRDIKQAAMQQLLTGKTRLPGFSGEWEVRRLGELGATYGGLVGKSKKDFGHGVAQYVPFVNVMANVVIDPDAFDAVDVGVGEVQNKVLIGDLLFNGSSETPEELAMCSLVDRKIENLFLNSFCFGFRMKIDAPANGLFMAYFMRGPVGREFVKSLAQGSTRYNLSKLALLNGQLRLPGKDEQAAIAKVLSDMDAELAALEARRDKTRLLKQGMMQELLTGKTRLV
ncbi:restriction endonuclease subunit S [Burkholderia multivorans]|nr:restriction endonuclease subunit S [Burkholderia multivorans]